MKILLANKFYYPRGGDCIHMFGLQTMLEEQGHEVAVFSMQYPENFAHECSRFWPSMLDFSSKNMGNLQEALFRPVYSREVNRKWNALLDSFQPDVVHLHNIHTQLSPLIAREAHTRGIPVYWTLHDYKLICPAYSFLRDGQVCEDCLRDPKSVVRHRCIKDSLPGSLIGYMEARAWTREKLERYTTGFIAPSAFMRDKMVAAGYSVAKFTQLYNFASVDKFCPELVKQPYYVFLGRLSKEKGVETLLQAAMACEDYPLMIIGEGPSRKELESRYQARHIHFLGFRKWRDIQEIVGGARFMVIPSEWYENNPLTIIEAHALGTPVLGARIGGIPEMISESNGMLFEPGDAHELKVKIQGMWLRENWNYDVISKVAAQKYSAKQYYEELMKVYGQ